MRPKELSPTSFPDITQGGCQVVCSYLIILLHRSQTLQTQEMLKKILIFTTLLPPLDAGVLPKSILVDIVLERGKVVIRMVLINLNTITDSWT